MSPLVNAFFLGLTLGLTLKLIPLNVTIPHSHRTGRHSQCSSFSQGQSPSQIHGKGLPAFSPLYLTHVHLFALACSPQVDLHRGGISASVFFSSPCEVNEQKSFVFGGFPKRFAQEIRPIYSITAKKFSVAFQNRSILLKSWSFCVKRT